MEIKKVIENNNAVFVLSGRLDTTTAPELEAELNSLENANTLVFDLKDIDYVSSAGLRVLLLASKIMSTKGGFKIINVNENVKEVLDMTGMSSVLTIE